MCLTKHSKHCLPIYGTSGIWGNMRRYSAKSKQVFLDLRKANPKLFATPVDEESPELDYNIGMQRDVEYHKKVMIQLENDRGYFEKGVIVLGSKFVMLFTMWQADKIKPIAFTVLLDVARLIMYVA